jgi:hypothetical protein
MEITQSEADELFAMKKIKADTQSYKFPDFGGVLRIPLQSEDGREKFMLDISRRRIELHRNKLQNRARQTIILARVDIGDAPHRNPDGEEIPCPHIHVFREGYDDKWAFPLPESFTNPSDAWITLQEFMTYCSISDAPDIKKGLFT